MKKILILLIAAMMIFTVGCKSAEKEDAKTEVEIPEVENQFKALGLDYTTGIEENGFYTDVKAVDSVEMVEYKGISIPNDVHTITEETIQNNIAQILSNFTSTNEITDRAVEDGDTLNIDYVGSVDGVEFEGGSTSGNGTDVTIGVTQYIDGFLVQLVGHNVGDSFDIDVTFPEDYHNTELAGKAAVFAITVNSITETVTPELTDEFVAEKLSADFDSNTVEEFTTVVAEELKNNAINGFINNYLVENFVVSTVNEIAVTYQETLMTNHHTFSAAQYGITVEEYLVTKVGVESFEALLEASGENIIKASEFGLIVQSIAEDAEITVTEEDLNAYFEKFTGSADYSQYLDLYGIGYLKKSALQIVVVDFLIENAVLEQ